MPSTKHLGLRLTFTMILLVGLAWSTPQLSSTASVKPGNKLVISEVMASNHSGLTDQDGDFSDWVEIYNPGPHSINLAGWSLTDDADQPQKWPFPNTTLAAQQYLFVFASGKNRTPTAPGAELHANFRLNKTGEFLGLYSVFENEFIDTLGQTSQLPEQFADIPYGRLADGQFVYLADATPGQPNASVGRWLDTISRVSFSVTRGLYQSPITLTLTTATPGAVIRYTTDGSIPTETHGTRYTAPIDIDATTLVRVAAFKTNFRPAPVETHSYIFINDVLAQSNTPAGFPQIWGAYEGVPVSADYEMDPEVINDPRYWAVIEQSLASIPSLSLVTDSQSFFELYANPQRKGRAWERPASVEFFDPSGTQRDFLINAGLRIQGMLGREEIMPKHSFRLFFRSEYGAAKLAYQLFPDSPVKTFETLVLRGGVNESYAGWFNGDYERATYTRDEWLRASQIAMSGASARGVFVHLYLNGLYWGVYNLIERPDAAFMASYFGGKEEEWNSVNHGEVLTSASQRFKKLHSLAAQGGLAEPKRYDLLKSYLDVPQFVDYLILNWYAGNIDWASNNWYAAVQAEAGQVQYFVWDGERTWFEGAEIDMEWDGNEEQPDLVTPLFHALLENPDFRIELADRIYRHLFNQGALTQENAGARWLALAQQVELAIIAESARWGDTRQERPLTQVDWYVARDDVLAQMQGNVHDFIEMTRAAGYYPPHDSPKFTVDHKDMNLTVTNYQFAHPSNPQSLLIYYTTDGSDPRQSVTGTVAPSAQLYTGPIELGDAARIKVRIFDPTAINNPWQGWSALNEATFTP